MPGCSVSVRISFDETCIKVGGVVNSKDPVCKLVHLGIPQPGMTIKILCHSRKTFTLLPIHCFIFSSGISRMFKLCPGLASLRSNRLVKSHHLRYKVLLVGPWP